MRSQIEWRVSIGGDGPVISIPSRTRPSFGESEGVRRSALPWRKIGSGREVEEQGGGGVGASGVGSIPETIMCCIAPALE